MIFVSHLLIGCFLLLFRLSDKRKHVEVNLIGDQFLEVLESKRGHAANIKTTKRKKINVPPGKGITPDALLGCEPNDISNEPVDDSSNSACSINVSSKRRRGRSLTKRLIQALSSSESSSDEEFSCDDKTSDESFGSLDENVPSVEGAGPSTENSASCVELIGSNNNYKVGDYVIVLYTGDGLHYPGKIVQIGKLSAVVRCMEKADGVSGSWRWPKRRDELTYEWQFVSKRIPAPKATSKRNLYSIDIEIR